MGIQFSVLSTKNWLDRTISVIWSNYTSGTAIFHTAWNQTLLRIVYHVHCQNWQYFSNESIGMDHFNPISAASTIDASILTYVYSLNGKFPISSFMHSTGSHFHSSRSSFSIDPSSPAWSPSTFTILHVQPGPVGRPSILFKNW